VYRGYNKKDSSEKLAIKIFDMSHAKKIESAYRELMIVMELPRHENLVEYKKIKVSSKNRIYVIMEECQFSLKTKLKQQQMSDFPEAEVWNFLSEFVAGYKILNKK
jgi:serine/threonine protein kinase